MTKPIEIPEVPGVTKKYLYYTVLKNFDTDTVRKETLEVVMNNRNCTKKEAG